MWLFFILDFGLKREKNPKEPQEALMRTISILDGTKYNLENFDILHSILPK